MRSNLNIEAGDLLLVKFYTQDRSPWIVLVLKRYNAAQEMSAVTMYSREFDLLHENYLISMNSLLTAVSIRKIS